MLLRTATILLLQIATLPQYALTTSKETTARPNVVIFIADDLGVGDLGCYGNGTIRTPHIDGMCRRGAKLSHHLAADAMCTPSRAAMLTGRYPIRQGMASNSWLRVFNNLAVTGGLPPNETTFAKVFQEKGYSTALIGKWHQGLHCQTSSDFCHHPNNHGFGFYYGTPMSNLRILAEDGVELLWARRPGLPRILTAVVVGGLLAALLLWKFVGRWAAVLVLLPAILYPLWTTAFIMWLPHLSSVLMRNTEVVEMPMNLDGMTQRLVEQGVAFLEDRQKDEKPFMLVMSWLQVHPVLHASEAFRGQSAHGVYGDEVEEMDWSVGQILQALDDNGFSDNTLVHFTSDHGAQSEETDKDGRPTGGHNGVFTGSKGQSSQEGGIRVPATFVMPGRIPAGLEITVPTTMMDVFTTLVELVDQPPPGDRVLDGRSLWPLLSGQTDRSPHRVLFHYCGHNLLAARLILENSSSVYKLHYAWPDWLHGTTTCRMQCNCNEHSWLDTPLLFDVTSDPTETHPLDTTLPEFVGVVEEIDRAVRGHKEGIESVPNQFSTSRSLFRPWLQPCCNFPSCRCAEDRNSNS